MTQPTPDGTQVDLCIVGAGISGLSLAAFVTPDLSVCILEDKPEVGGLLQSKLVGEARFDLAANGWLDSEPSVEMLIDKIGLGPQIEPANRDKATRYLVYNQRLHALSPRLLFKSSPLISWWQKLRALREIFIAPAFKNDLSLADAMRQRFGDGVVDNFLSPMCAGIYADKPENISVQAAFPSLWSMLQKGSLIRQLLKKQRQSKGKSPHLTSCKQGAFELCEGIQAFLQKHDVELRLGRPATHLSYSKDTPYPWSIHTSTGVVQAKSIALTCPATAQSTLLRPLFPEIAQLQDKIQYSPVALVLQTFERSAFKQDASQLQVEGFGALMTRQDQQEGLLGVLFTSHLFPNRFPEHIVCTRSIFGGAILPEIVDAPDSDLQETALKAHQKMFNSPSLIPMNTDVIRWEKGIPQYTLKHPLIQNQIVAFHNREATVRLSGNHLFGVAVKDCIRISFEHAQHFLQQLSTSSPELSQ